MSAGLIEPCPWSLVAIHWVDAFDSTEGWVEMKSYKPSRCDVISVGWIWPDLLDGYLSITGSYMADELPEMQTVGMVTHIPVGMVQRVVVLGTPDFNSVAPQP
jgi:hypothetical protein